MFVLLTPINWLRIQQVHNAHDYASFGMPMTRLSNHPLIYMPLQSLDPSRVLWTIPKRRLSHHMEVMGLSYNSHLDQLVTVMKRFFWSLSFYFFLPLICLSDFFSSLPSIFLSLWTLYHFAHSLWTCTHGFYLKKKITLTCESNLYKALLVRLINVHLANQQFLYSTGHYIIFCLFFASFWWLMSEVNHQNACLCV